jgi:general secretion pathway protein D
MMHVRAACSAFVTCALFSIIISPACAQTAVRATLLRLSVVVGPDRIAHVSLQTDGPSSQVQLFGNGTSMILINAPGMQVPPQLPLDYQGRGTIQNVTLHPQGAAVTIAVTLKHPATATLRRAGTLLILDIPDTSDSSPPATQGPPRESATVGGERTEVILLNYADVSEVAGALVGGASVASNDTFSPNPSEFGNTLGTFAGVGTATPAALGMQSGVTAPSVAQRLNANVAIDRRLNAVILTGPPALLSALKSLVAAIDIPVQSVLLEAKVVELSESAARSVGLDFTNTAGQAATATITTSSFTPPQITATFQAALLAQITSGNGRMLANPSILAQSGQPASILTGDAIPVLTTITFPGSSTFTQTQVQYVNVGVDLQIQPRVTADGFVTSHIFSQVSSVTAYVQGVPQISQRRASTSATVRDGQAFIIGGLLQNDELKSLQKIPFLGDVPLIGGLFRVTKFTAQKTNLYIMITPHITTK